MYEDLISNLTGNGFDAQVAGTAAEAKALIMDMIPGGVDVGVGGSMTVSASSGSSPPCARGATRSSTTGRRACRPESPGGSSSGS